MRTKYKELNQKEEDIARQINDLLVTISNENNDMDFSDFIKKSHANILRKELYLDSQARKLLPNHLSDQLFLKITLGTILIECIRILTSPAIRNNTLMKKISHLENNIIYNEQESLEKFHAFLIASRDYERQSSNIKKQKEGPFVFALLEQALIFRNLINTKTSTDLTSAIIRLVDVYSNYVIERNVRETNYRNN